MGWILRYKTPRRLNALGMQGNCATWTELLDQASLRSPEGCCCQCYLVFSSINCWLPTTPFIGIGKCLSGNEDVHSVLSPAIALTTDPIILHTSPQFFCIFFLSHELYACLDRLEGCAVPFRMRATGRSLLILWKEWLHHPEAYTALLPGKISLSCVWIPLIVRPIELKVCIAGDSWSPAWILRRKCQLS